MASLRDVWPLAGLVVRTPRLELRWATDDDLVALAELAVAGVHDDDFMPFGRPWTRGEPGEVARRVLQFHWGRRADWTPEAWSWEAVVVAGGTIVGTQGMGARDFATCRTVGTGSWLGRAYQGEGIGTEMRSAMLHLAFAGLRAERAETGAWEDNAPSLGVTTRLGYRPNGDRILDNEGAPRRELLYVLDRADWEPTGRTDIEIEGLAPCLPLFDAAAEPEGLDAPSQPTDRTAAPGNAVVASRSSG